MYVCINMYVYVCMYVCNIWLIKYDKIIMK